MTGAELERLANAAALIALRKGRERIEMRDFEDARDESLMGMVREETISAAEKRITAYHEAGHTVVAWELPGTDPVHKVGIVPRGQAMGATQLLPKEDRHYYPRRFLEGKLAVALGGRVAERLVFADTSTGAQSDLKEATDIAEKMVAQWGMSAKVGPMYVDRGEEHPFLGRKLTEGKSYSEELAALMDQEIRALVLTAESRAGGDPAGEPRVPGEGRAGAARRGSARRGADRGGHRAPEGARRNAGGGRKAVDLK